jgi:rhamnogalacturonan acetylesterase
MKRSLSAYILTLLWIVGAVVSAAAQDKKGSDAKSIKPLPTLFIIGDSTVNNSGEGMQGWGNVIGEFFDKTKINVINRARGGRSSRTFQTEGLWDQVLSEIKPEDVVLIQFGHNDGGPIDKEKYRGSLKGIGNEVQEITIDVTGKKEIVHTYGWYMRKYVADAKAKGAIPIVLSPVPRNIWKEGKVVRASADYGLWAKESAESGKAFFVDLNEIVAEHYEKDGQEKVGTAYFTTKDHTHTSAAGARVNADSVIDGLKKLKRSPLKRFILSK